jgi:hydroxymethylpyrimidine/phosphomethylpyrimidine kinase
VPGVLSIGTTDPWNAAGIGVDAHVLAALGVRGFLVVAGVSAQGPLGVRSLFPLPPEAIVDQIASLRDAPIDAIRIGVVPGAQTVAAVAASLAHHAAPIVLDPVIAASAGGALASEETVAAIAALLVPRATLVTPNLAEAAALTGRKVTTTDEMVAAGRQLVALGARAVVVTGGHLAGDPVDVLIRHGTAPAFFSAPRLEEMRGTGCVFAAACAAHLARGSSIPNAVIEARAYVRERIANARVVSGMRTAF